MKKFSEFYESIEDDQRHYSEQILSVLANNYGWTYKSDLSVEKKIKNVALAGSFSDGTRIINAHFDKQGRYLEAKLGWDTLMDMDCRPYAKVPEKAAQEFEKNLGAVVAKLSRSM